MKVPAEVIEKVAELGRRVLEDDAEEVDIGEEGAIWLRDRQRAFALDVLADWWRKRTRSWIYAQAHDALSDDRVPEQMVLPFPELHEYLEVAPGSLKHQNVMTGTDWDKTLAIYRNRRDQAEQMFRAIERRYQQIRHLLDGEMTTADVVDRLAPAKVG